MNKARAFTAYDWISIVVGVMSLVPVAFAMFGERSSYTVAYLGAACLLIILSRATSVWQTMSNPLRLALTTVLLIAVVAGTIYWLSLPVGNNVVAGVAFMLAATAAFLMIIPTRNRLVTMRKPPPEVK